MTTRLLFNSTGERKSQKTLLSVSTILTIAVAAGTFTSKVTLGIV